MAGAGAIGACWLARVVVLARERPGSRGGLGADRWDVDRSRDDGDGAGGGARNADGAWTLAGGTGLDFLGGGGAGRGSALKGVLGVGGVGPAEEDKGAWPILSKTSISPPPSW